MTNKATAARKFAVLHNEEVKGRVEKAAAVSEEVTRRMEDAVEVAYSRTATATIEFHQKALAIAQASVDAAFECARELVGVTSPSEFIEVSNKHARQQLQAITRQSKELAELAQKAAIESMGPFGTMVGGALLGRPDLS